ncbi:uncharacterized protein MAM_06696 [Metarhizium album ARSEF 1941]|uniref:Uncharacterized protein n=1 Tax=Metarhizium album (strain ARSEF 1941) TaxID=1081103 RepID=A0A0B2WP17_METAS|nr:uncharacterized protein MAM_06696 [Metarhizium album ARSEF 1941]KHN95419.1 hypothetical protein MAM_06696 [Metarhizium album ARSEF 1941]
MDLGTSDAVQRDEPKATSDHRRASSGSGLLSKFPFLRTSAEIKTRLDIEEDDALTPVATAPLALAPLAQLQKTRRRRGSLRKAALLGRGAQREKKDTKLLKIDTLSTAAIEAEVVGASSSSGITERDALGLEVSDFTPHLVSTDVPLKISAASSQSGADAMAKGDHRERYAERRNGYNSTTDEEDILQIPRNQGPPLSTLSASSGSESYFTNRTTAARRRSFQQTKSPLSYSGISTTALPHPDSDWDYSETEWWGWVVLSITWFVFVIGMGSCLNVWTWAWDVGKTPYAPPELENDETLPIVGYYPALIILTGVMAWVWVVVAWVGMKYFRHAKISGD